jgi:hypothetical protein
MLEEVERKETNVNLAVNLNRKEQQSTLYGFLDEVLKVSQTKFRMEKAGNSDRQRWARIIISAVQAYGNLLEIAKLEEIEERLKMVEKLTGTGR